MCYVAVVMDAPGRRVGDEEVQIASVACFVEQQAGHHLDQVERHVLLSVLVRPIVIKRAALNPGHQQGWHIIACAYLTQAPVQIVRSWVR